MQNSIELLEKQLTSKKMQEHGKSFRNSGKSKTWDENSMETVN